MYLKVADKYRINLKEILKSYGWKIEPEHQYLYKVIDDGLYKAELFIYSISYRSIRRNIIII